MPADITSASKVVELFRLRFQVAVTFIISYPNLKGPPKLPSYVFFIHNS
jgi:hypothetical protein